MENEFGSLGRGNSSGARSFRPARTKLADLLDNITIPDDPIEDAIANPAQDNVDGSLQSDASREKGVRPHNVEEGSVNAPSSGENGFAPQGPAADSESLLPTSGLNRWSPANDLVDGNAASNARPPFQDNPVPTKSTVPAKGAMPAKGDVAQAAHAFRVNMDKQEKAGHDADRPSNINIKGRADGISIEVGRGNWPELTSELSERLRQASGFFRGGKVTLDVGIRPLQEGELQQVVSILEQHSMTLGVIKTTSEQTCQIALANGLAASLDAPEGLQAQEAYSNQESLQHFVYRGNIRSGQILQRTETVLILGDVNPGAQVISHGDILIWGRLRGIVHAGANGDTNAVIAALAMLPTQIRIAQLTAILPEEKPVRNSRWLSGQESFRRPEIAFASSNQIIVEPWDESKPGGIMAFRR